MMFVFYLMTVAFGVAVTVMGVVLLVVALTQKHNRRLLSTLGLLALVTAWLPTVAFFVFLYANGARPAGG